MPRPFHFRHFSMQHHMSTMKVGTDAVMLGAWAEVKDAMQVLDIGTGSGILALMTAQRNPIAQIVAIDVDSASITEAAQNFARSPWGARLKACLADVVSFAESNQKHFDMIITNPPFFENHIRSVNRKRNLARHNDNLSYDNLLVSCTKLLKDRGKVAIVLPWEVGQKMIRIAPDFQLSAARIQHIVPVEGRNPNRMHLELIKDNCSEPQISYFTIREANLKFTKAYQQLLGDFYLGFDQ